MALEGLPTDEATRPAPLDARKALLALAVFFFVQAGVGAALGLWVAATLALQGGDPSDVEAIRRALKGSIGPTGIISAIAAGGIVLWATLLRGKGAIAIDARREEGFAIGPRHRLVAALLAGLLFGVAYVLLAGWLFPPPADHEPGPLTKMASSGGWRRFGWTLAGLLYAPFFEEFLFRGVLFGGLKRSWGAPRATVFTTLLFILLHYAEISVYWPAIVGVSALAVLTLALRIATRALGPSIAVHLGYNLTMVILVHAFG